METALTAKSVQTFRLPNYLIEKLRKLAKGENRSLNNYVETVLLDVAFHEPNEVTLAAMKEAREGKTEGPIDTTSVEAMLKSMGL